MKFDEELMNYEASCSFRISFIRHALLIDFIDLRMKGVLAHGIHSQSISRNQSINALAGLKRHFICGFQFVLNLPL